MTKPLDHIADIAATFAATDIVVLELTGPTGSLRLRRELAGLTVETGEPTAIDVEAAADAARVTTVTASSFGHFLATHPLRDTPLVSPGDRVVAGQTIGLLRIGALLIPIVAPRDGIVTASIAVEGALVGYGEPIVELHSATAGEPA